MTTITSTRIFFYFIYLCKRLRIFIRWPIKAMLKYFFFILFTQYNFLFLLYNILFLLYNILFPLYNILFPRERYFVPTAYYIILTRSVFCSHSILYYSHKICIIFTPHIIYYTYLLSIKGS